MSGELVHGEQSGPEKIISNKQWHHARRKSITQNVESLESRNKKSDVGIEDQTTHHF